MAVVQDMLAAIAVKYNLKEKGLDPGAVPEVVAQAFAAIVRRRPPPPARARAAAAPARRARPARGRGAGLPGPGGAESGLVSEELLHRAIRSNVELAEALGQPGARDEPGPRRASSPRPTS